MPDIKVTLDTSVNPHLLVINDGKDIEIKWNGNIQKITWMLKGNPLKNGEFEPIKQPEPGFEWVPSPDIPPVGYFGEPEVSQNKKSLELIDNHLNASTNGQWKYRIRVKLDGVVYSETAPFPVGTRSNPIIINH